MTPASLVARALVVLALAALVGCAERAAAGAAAHPEEVGAVALLHSRIQGAPAICSGVLVAARSVLTAAHCRPVLEGEEVAVWIGGRPHFVARTVRHFERDLMWVTLSDAVTDMAPVSLGLDAPTSSWLGRSALIASARGGGWSALHTLHAIEASHLVAAGTEHEGVCSGDSGSPLFIDLDGHDVVVAILSTGAYDCRGHGRYTRLDGARAWIEAQLASDPGR